MALEERASSAALSLVDILESNEHSRTRLYVAAGAALATIVMWVVHVTYPEVFTFFIDVDGWAKLALGVVLAPPFLVGLGAGSFLFPQAIKPTSTVESGPMSTFFYQEQASRRWKILIGAGALAAVNLLLMFITARI